MRVSSSSSTTIYYRCSSNNVKPCLGWMVFLCSLALSVGRLQAFSVSKPNHANTRASQGSRTAWSPVGWPTRTTLLNAHHRHQHFEHALAILVMPETSMDRIANEAILETVLGSLSSSTPPPTTTPTTRNNTTRRPKKVSIVLRCQKGVVPTTASLRRAVGEIYSQLWDVALNGNGKPTIATSSAMSSSSATPTQQQHNGDDEDFLPNVIVYPQNLPNAAPESWIDILPDLDCICSHDATVGWTSECSASAKRYESIHGNGVGGLDDHVANVNRERANRKLKPVQALHVDHSQYQRFVNEASHAIFLDDEEPAVVWKPKINDKDDNNIIDAEKQQPCSMLSGAVPPQHVYDSVCVGGTFDGLHFGHRKLLTLAVSSVTPMTGTLLVGVTVDAMLQKKEFCEHIPVFAERCNGVRQFLHRFAPGMIDRMQILPITDAFGPPGQKPSEKNSNNKKFDAIVLSHETLHTGYLLNQYRVNELNLPPLQLLCTRRTEAHGMSSTALRRIRQQRRQEKQQQMQQQLQQQ